MESITIGLSVKIKRTDGRVHSAVVSKINPLGKSITVEWYERGETKGKEVELDAILSLNPELTNEEFKSSSPVPSEQRKLSNAAHVPANLSRSNLTQQQQQQQQQQLQTALQQQQIPQPTTTNSGFRTSRATMNSSSMIAVPTAAANQSEFTQPMPATGIVRSRTTNNATRLASASGNASNNVNNTIATGGNTNSGANSVSVASTSNAGNIVGARRSYVVKEVERLKENREKRRARQAEMKEEKVALMNQDPGNPNWETAQMIREFQSSLDFNPLIDGQPVEEHQITVCVRKRPLSRKEINRKELDVISVPRKDTLIVHEPRNKVDLTKFLENHKFRFDYAFDDRCDNAMVYKYTAKPLVQTIFEGGMATCFAYGQTGAGKTHTMGGEFNGKIQDCKNGIYAMAAKDVFAYLNNPRYRPLNLVVSASFFEIYSGKVFDLLSEKQKLRVLEDGKQQVQVVGLNEKVVEGVEDVLKIITLGNSARTSGQTSANSNSSRSHAVFQIVLRQAGSQKIHGKFSFIDLAGNERGADTSSANRQTRMEGAEINKSLLALKECIRALGKQSAHLPFRVSKLTQVLRDSFIGEKSKTCMIAMISPGLSSCEHTLNTLRYADRVKELVVRDTQDDVLLEEDGEQLLKNELDDDDDDDNDDMTQQYVVNRDRHLQVNKQEQHQHQQHQQNINNNNISNNNKKNGQMSTNELALLRSLSEHDMSDEMLVQQEAISDLQQSEENVVDLHRAVNDYLTSFLPDSLRLYDLTNYVDYDQDAYCKKGEAIFTQLAEFAINCRDAMADFRAKLTKEELLSHTVKPPNGKR